MKKNTSEKTWPLIRGFANLGLIPDPAIYYVLPDEYS